MSSQIKKRNSEENEYLFTEIPYNYIIFHQIPEYLGNGFINILFYARAKQIWANTIDKRLNPMPRQEALDLSVKY